MTQEEKQLLLVDLCARLPYDVQGITSEGEISPLLTRGEADWDILTSFNYRIVKHGWRPYLRQMSSMTKAEIADAIKYIFNTDKVVYKSDAEGNGFYAVKNKMQIKVDDLQIKLGYYGINNIDWLNKYHFDYRGLIPMGLALEAPEGMYNTKIE